MKFSAEKRCVLCCKYTLSIGRLKTGIQITPISNKIWDLQTNYFCSFNVWEYPHNEVAIANKIFWLLRGALKLDQNKPNLFKTYVRPISECCYQIYPSMRYCNRLAMEKVRRAFGKQRVGMSFPRSGNIKDPGPLQSVTGTSFSPCRYFFIGHTRSFFYSSYLPILVCFCPYMREPKWPQHVPFSIFQRGNSRPPRHLQKIHKCSGKLSLDRGTIESTLMGSAIPVSKKDSAGISSSPLAEAYSGWKGMGHLQWICISITQTWSCQKGNLTSPLSVYKHLAALMHDLKK